MQLILGNIFPSISPESTGDQSATVEGTGH